MSTIAWRTKPGATGWYFFKRCPTDGNVVVVFVGRDSDHHHTFIALADPLRIYQDIMLNHGRPYERTPSEYPEALWCNIEVPPVPEYKELLQEVIAQHLD